MDTPAKFFCTVDQLLQGHISLPKDKLKQCLSKSIDGRLPCMYLYHAWAIAEMCCASADWSSPFLAAVLFPTGMRSPVSDILADLFDALKKTEVPRTEGTDEPDLDNRILLLDSLKRAELAQALRLGVPLYTPDGGCLK